eukprot:403342444
MQLNNNNLLLLLAKSLPQQNKIIIVYLLKRILNSQLKEEPQIIEQQIETPIKTNNKTERIQVAVRIRPKLQSEYLSDDVVQSDGQSNKIRVTDSVHLIESKYDLVLDQKSSQSQIYAFVSEAVKCVLSGINSTIFAYGQTGSGKTYSMFGPQWEESIKLNKRHQRSQIKNNLREQMFGLNQEQEGVIPRAIREIFQEIRNKNDKQHTVYCSFIQIYNEKIFDLLQDADAKNPLKIREEEKNQIYVEGLSEYVVQTEKDCFGLLRRGEINRITRSTKKNMVSSRSHSIFQLMIESDKADARGFINRAKLNLCDLAGSEKIIGLLEHSQDSDAHLSELKTINLSLTTLGKVISALSKEGRNNKKHEKMNAPLGVTKQDYFKSKVHVPYRDSQLTRMLQDSLGGNTRTVLIATVSPVSDNVEETISTLKFADRAKQVMTNARINEINAHDDALVQKLQKELQSLREVLTLRKRGQNDDVQNQLIHLKQENIKLKEIAENVDMVEKLKVENKLMRLEIQRLRDGSNFGDTLRSTDMSLVDTFSSSSKMIRRSQNSNKIESFMDFHDTEPSVNDQRSYDNSALMIVQNQKRQKVKAFQGSLKENGRCPICTLMPPCNHYKDIAEINRQGIFEENEDQEQEYQKSIGASPGLSHLKTNNTQSLPLLTAVQQRQSPLGREKDKTKLSLFSPRESNYTQLKSQNFTQKHSSIVKPSIFQLDTQLPEINTSSSKYSKMKGKDIGQDFGQTITQRYNSNTSNIQNQRYKNNQLNLRQNHLLTESDALDIIEDDINENLLNVRIRGRNHQFTNQKANLYSTLEEIKTQNNHMIDIYKQQQRVKMLDKIQKEREIKQKQNFESELQRIKQKYHKNKQQL